MLKNFVLSIGWIALLGMVGCGSLTSKRNDEALKQVKKIAIVGFAVRAPAPKSLSFSLNSGKVEGASGGSMIPQNAGEYEQMYGELVRTFGKNVSWTVIPPATMKKNAGYLAAYDRTMKGWQNKMPPGEGQKQFLVDGIMDNDALRIMGPDGRTDLIKALGVDAIVTAQVAVMLNGTSIMGIGDLYPQSRLSFWLYTKGASAPDWFEGGIDGEEAKTSVGKTAFFNEKLMQELALKSSRSAFQKIGATPKK